MGRNVLVSIRNILLGLVLSGLAVAQSTSIKGSLTVKGAVDLGPLDVGVSLVSISIQPLTPTQVVPNSVTFTASGTFSDGSSADVTAQVTANNGWSAIGTGVTNNGNIFTCNQATTVVVQAQIAFLTTNTTLTCLSIQIQPQGVLTAFQSQPFSQLFTASNGTPPYTFSSSDLPGWLSLSSSGCPSGQVNCNLNGTQNNIAVYNFHITATDSLNANLTIPIAVQVTGSQAEDELYCNIGTHPRDFEGTFTLAGQFDGTAQYPDFCPFDTIAATPASGPILLVCPSTQKDVNGVPIQGCLHAQTPGFFNYFNTVQLAMNNAVCGDWIQIYANNPDGVQPNTFQNVYHESLTAPGTTCGANDPQGTGSAPGQWIWMTTNLYNQLPPPGSRISPAWAGQTSLPGHPSFPSPSVPGNYVPAIQPTGCTIGASCQALAFENPGTSGWRTMGIEFFEQKATGPSGTAPGFSPPIIDVNCPQANGKPNCGNKGVQDIVFDRILIHACQNKSDSTCTDETAIALRMQNMNYGSVINSYIYGMKTLGDNHGNISPTDEGKCFAGGNVQTHVDDGPINFTNNFCEGAAENAFLGGAVSNNNIFAKNYQFRRNHFFKPLTWKVGDPAFAGGSIVDAWITTSGQANLSWTTTAPTCSIPNSPLYNGTNPQVNATCVVVAVIGGPLTSITITNAGAGYNLANAGAITITDPVNGVLCPRPAPFGACAQPEDGIYIVKNPFEAKNGDQVLYEGNIVENNWIGQADQFGHAMLIDATNQHQQPPSPGACPTCETRNWIIRRSIFSKVATGITIGGENQGDVLPQYSGPASLSDIVLEMNGTYWIKDPTQFNAASGTGFKIGNVQAQPFTTSNVKCNHCTLIHSEPRNIPGTETLSGGMNLSNAWCGIKTPLHAVINGITLENSIFSGGIKLNSNANNGCFFANTNTSGSRNAIDGFATSFRLGVPSGGLYPLNIVTGIQLLTSGSCPANDLVTGATITGDGSGATANVHLDKNGQVQFVNPGAVGKNYSTATISFQGCSTGTLPTANVILGGANNPSPSGPYCIDHNANVTNAFTGEVDSNFAATMNAIETGSTAQGDSPNSCVSANGGGNIDLTNPLVPGWSVVGFVNMPLDAQGAEIPTGDLHLCHTINTFCPAISPLVNAGNGDNRGDTGPNANDLGADYDLVLRFIGASVQNGVTVFPP